MPRVQVVLVRPETPANIGATARIIRSTGLQGLALVRPGDWRTVECWRTAWGAHDVLESARVLADLSAALAGSCYTVAFSGRRSGGAPVLDVRDVAAELQSMGEEDPASLVFGPETTGLSEDDVSLCGRRAVIPSHPDQPSLNLSHAVMVAAYEVFRAGSRPGSGPRRATHGEKEGLLAILRGGLEAIDALPRTNADARFVEWKALFQRADLTPKEVRLLEHMARKMARRG